MILTEEFLKNQNACEEGIQACRENNYIGQEYDTVIRNFITNNRRDFAGWMVEQKKTISYVRANGRIITMASYQVFNPLTGVHTEYQTESEAATAIADICQEILQIHKPTVCQALVNENGDSTWIPIDISPSHVHVTIPTP
jgi:hypothetical protein